MKTAIYLLLFVLLMAGPIAIAQNLAPSTNQNYILTQTPREATTGTLSGTTPYTTAVATIQYFDGLGRPTQTVQWRGAGNAATDIATQTITYDAFGRPNVSTLPTPTNASTGAFFADPTPTAQNFYGDTHPYTQTTYEPSPLNRITTQTGPGQNWRTPTTRSSTIQYGVAQPNSVIRFIFNGFCVCLYGHIENQTPANYYASTDIATQTNTDEQGNTIISYIDLQGRVVRKDVRVSSGQVLTTAYVYDDFERLVVILPPAAYNWFTADITRNLFVYNNGADDATFSELAYGYLYDTRGRVIRKNVPGAGWTDLIYDTSDRLVMSQDAQDKAEAGGARWRFSKYDGLNRVVQTGRLTLNATAASLQSAFAALSQDSYPVSVNPSASDLLTENFYDNYTGAVFGFNSSGAFATPWPNATGSLTRSRVRNLDTGAWYELVFWYDDKGRIIQQQSQNHFGGSDRVDIQYRFNGEVLQSVLRHQPGSSAAITTVASSYSYDHIGRKTQVSHSLNGAVPTVLAVYQYDGIGRLTGKSLGGGLGIASQQTGNWNVGSTWAGNVVPSNSDRVLISANHAVTIPANTTVGAGKLMYGLGGRLLFGSPFSRLRLNGGSGSSSNTLQTLTYNYHIRGGLRGINLNSSGNPDLAGGQLFAMKLGYEDVGLYDGNIGSQTWLNGSQPNQTRSYTYSYDGASRLTGATYGGGIYTLNGLSYDVNGNIQTMNRAGVDALSYRYQTNSNKLLAVTDGNASSEGFADGNKTGDDYEYWPDGSLKKDLNRGMSLIEYNLLKLPRKITFTNGTTVIYQYDATGKKLKMTTSAGEVRDYIGPFQYLTPAGGSIGLFEIATDEGRYTPTGGYEYFHKDHLGNVRVVFGSSGISQYTDYDPWGLPLWGGLNGGSSTNRMKFNGKEAVSELGNGQYDLGSRGYDSQIGRLKSIDRFAEKYYDQSGYQYGANNPVLNIDMNGDSIIISHNNEEILYQDGKLYWSNSGMKAYDGKALNKKGEAKGFVGEVFNALNKVSSGGESGNDLVGKLQDFKGRVKISQGEENGTRGIKIFWNSSLTEGGQDEKGSTSRPAYIGLAHEMAHAFDLIEDGSVDFGSWYKDETLNRPVPKAEIFSTHIENKIRAENNLPLRAYYSSTAIGGLRVIDVNNGMSLFYGNTKVIMPELAYPTFLYQYKPILK